MASGSGIKLRIDVPLLMKTGILLIILSMSICPVIEGMEGTWRSYVDSVITESQDRTSSRQGGGNGSGNGTIPDTEPPVALPGSYKAIFQGRYLQLDGRNSYDKVKGDYENLTFKWSFLHGGYVNLTGPTPRYRFTNHGDYLIVMEISDQAGNSAADSIQITIIEDTTGPAIVSSFPENNQMEVPLDVTPKVVFKDDKNALPAVDPASIEGNVVMRPYGKNDEMNINWTLSENGTVLTVVPQDELKRDATYTIAVKEGIYDVAGNNLSVEDLGWEFSFSTVRSLEKPSFQVFPSDPAGGEEVKIILEFNKRLDPSTVSTETISISGSDGPCPILIRIGENLSRVDISLVGQVDFGSKYVLSMSGRITDEGGGELGSDVVQPLFHTVKKERRDRQAPLFMYFLMAFSACVAVFLIYVLYERKKLTSRRGFQEASRQLDRRRKRSRLIKSLSVEEDGAKGRGKTGGKKARGRRSGRGDSGGDVIIERSDRSERGRGQDRGKGGGKKGGMDGENDWGGRGRRGEEQRVERRTEGIMHEKRDSSGGRGNAGRGKVSYYHPEERSTFKGRTYDVHHFDEFDGEHAEGRGRNMGRRDMGRRDMGGKGGGVSRGGGRGRHPRRSTRDSGRGGRRGGRDHSDRDMGGMAGRRRGRPPRRDTDVDWG